MTSDFCVAVHALVYLHHRNCVLNSEELAKNICTNPARIRKVLSQLKKADLVGAKEGGAGSGYRFLLDPAQVSLARIADALKVRFVDAAWHSGDSDQPCLIASGMAGLMDGVFEDLNQRCVMRLQEVSVADLERKIFVEQGANAR